MRQPVWLLLILLTAIGALGGGRMDSHATDTPRSSPAVQEDKGEKADAGEIQSRVVPLRPPGPGLSHTSTGCGCLKGFGSCTVVTTETGHHCAKLKKDTCTGACDNLPANSGAGTFLP
jgi:hypothetical protein